MDSPSLTTGERIARLCFFCFLSPGEAAEEFVGIDVVNAAESDQFHQARVGFFAGLQTREITLGDVSPAVGRQAGNASHLAHRELAFCP